MHEDLPGQAIAGPAGLRARGAGVAASASATASSAPAAPVLTAYSSSAESVIAANWTAFFNPGTPVAKWIALLQDGQQFTAIIKSQASSGLAAQASVKVIKVTLVSPTQAKVVYTIYEGGKPALANQTGVAVKQDGTWKVGAARGGPGGGPGPPGHRRPGPGSV